MANFNIYIDSSSTADNHAGWSAILASSRSRILDHQMGSVENCSARRALFIALIEALKLTVEEKKKNSYSIYIPDREVYDSYFRGKYEKESGITTEEIATLREFKISSYNAVVHFSVEKSDAQILAKVVAGSAPNFSYMYNQTQQ